MCSTRMTTWVEWGACLGSNLATFKQIFKILNIKTCVLLKILAKLKII
jgi:hypothetical protein